MAELVVRLLAFAAVFAAVLPLARAAARRADGARHPDAAAFGVALPFGGYAKHALLVSGAALVLALGVWTMAAPGVAIELLTDRAPLARISWPFLLSGVAALYLVVWLAGAVGAPVAERAARFGRAAGPAADMALRLLLLIPATAGVFALFSALTGAFGGDWRSAVGAVPSSLAYGLAAAGISGVFVWAAVLSGLPMTLAAALIRAGLRPDAAGLGAAAGLALAAAPAAVALALLA